MMGLYDTVICDYPLPLPEFTEEELDDINHDDLDKLNWSEVEWQTKDLDSLLDVYTIEDDGQVYTQKTDWQHLHEEEGVLPVEGELEKCERTCEIVFYNAILGKKYDHWIEFKAVIWKGDLKEIELVEYKKTENDERIKMQQAIQKQVKKAQSRGKLYNIYKFLISTPLGIFRSVLNWIVNITFKLERWLT